MSNPPDLPPDPHAPPTAPMYPVPPSQPPSSQEPPPPTYEAPTYQAPTYQAPTYPAPTYQPPSYQPPPAYQEPPAGYSVPPQYSAMPAAADYGDPLVLPLGAPFGAWFRKVLEVGKRSWRSALVITGLGIVLPDAAVSLVSSIGGWSGGLTFSLLTGLGDRLGTYFLGLLVTLVVWLAACYVSAAGWAAGTWALVQEAQTGRPADVNAAFRYGFKRAMALFPWTVLAAVAVGLASVCLILPGIYVAFGFSMFGFVAIFERGVNPVSRSFSLTHNSATIGPTLGKIGILFGIYLVYSLIVGGIFTVIAAAVGLAMGLTGSTGYHIGFGVINAIGTLLLTPAVALLLIGLLPTYAELRARQSPLRTSQLKQELGG